MSVVHVNSISGITSITTPSSSDVLTLHTSNNAERLRITSDGKISTGALASADGNLHVHNSTAGSVTAAADANELILESAANVGMTFLTANNSISRIKFGDTTATNRGIFYFNHSDASFNFQHGSDNRLKIDSSGQMGLGITPVKPFNIVAGVGTTEFIRLSQPVDASVQQNFGIGWCSNNNHTWPGAQITSLEYDVSDPRRSLVFYTRGVNSDSAPTERLRITSAGDLSLRSTTQNAHLGLTANSTAINFTLGSTAGASPRMYFYGTGNGQSSAGDIFTGSGNGGILHYRSGGLIKFEVNSDNTTAEALRIKSDGNVTLGSSGHNLSQVGGEEISGQDYDAILKIYSQTDSRWLMQGRSDTSTNPNGIFIRSGNAASNYSLYTCGIDESKTHLVVNGLGSVGVGTATPNVDNRPGLHLYSTHTDSCRLVFETPTKDNTRIGYFGLNRFGMDVCHGFQIRDSKDSYATRLLIDSTGNFYYDTESQGPHGGHFNIDSSSSSRNGLNVKGTTANYVIISSAGGSTGDHIYFSNWSNSNTNTGRIKDNSSNVTYHTSSDYRLKDNVVSISDGITRVKQLNPVRHTWKTNPAIGTVDGWIAHEVDAICPDAVDGVKDAVNDDGSIYPQAVDYGRITPLLTAALKEVIVKIETLEAEVAALKSS